MAHLAMGSGLIRRHAAFLVGVVLVFTFCRRPSLTGWDDAFYLAKLTSALGDSDLVLQDDLQALLNPPDEKLRTLTTVLGDGALFNTFGIGLALVNAFYLWPLFAAGLDDAWWLRAALGVGAMAALFLLFLATRAALLRFGYAPGVAAVATFLAIAAGPLAIYSTTVTTLSHLWSALFASALIVTVLRWLEAPTVARALLVGAAAGILVVVRWQDVILVCALGIGGLALRRSIGMAHYRTLAVAMVPFALALACQVFAWRAQFGHGLLIPQGSSYLNWTAPALIPFLFSLYHGFVPWTPFFAFGLLLAWHGVPGAAPASRLLRVWFAVATIATIWTSAAVRDWWGGSSFGARRLAVLTPLAAFGLAFVLRRLGAVGRCVLVLAAFSWAVFAVTAFVSGYDDLRVLVVGKVDPFSDRRIESYASVRWIDDEVNLPFVLRPGFTFVDVGGNRHRLLGLAAVFLIGAGVSWGWRCVAKSARAETLLAASAVAWLAGAAAWLGLRVPSNAVANAAWRRIVVEGHSPPPALPYKLDEPAHLVAAQRALENGDCAAFDRLAAGIGAAGPARDELLRGRASPHPCACGSDCTGAALTRPSLPACAGTPAR